MAPTYKITYFPVKALGEPIRFLLSYAGHSFEDYRFQTTQWPTIKPTMPFGKVPILEIDGKVIHQSVAICRYLGKQSNINGDNDWDALQIDMIVDTINDFRSQCVEFFRSVFHNSDKAAVDKSREALLRDVVPFYFPKLEEIVKTNKGYFVNGKLSWADLYFAAQADSWIGGFGQDILSGYPQLQALYRRVFALPAIKAWLDKRPPTDNNY